MSEMAQLPVDPTEAPVFPHLSHASSFKRRPRLLPRLGGGAALLAAVAFAAPATSAQAALIDTSACSEAPLGQPFAQWDDTSYYELVPQGDFAGSLSEWTLSGGAVRTTGGEPGTVAGADSGYALSLPAGASAQSPHVCLDADYPTFRFFARGGLLSTLAVQVVYETPLGTVALPLGVVLPGGTWEPTPPLLTGSVVAGLLTGGTAQASLRFTALAGTSEIDDVFVDPRMR